MYKRKKVNVIKREGMGREREWCCERMLRREDERKSDKKSTVRMYEGSENESVKEKTKGKERDMRVSRMWKNVEEMIRTYNANKIRKMRKQERL